MEATAHHEAGHATAAFLLGFRIRSASIVPGQDPGEPYQGIVRYAPRGRLDLSSASPVMRQKAENLLIVTLAGDIAQRRFNPRSSRSWQTSEDRSQAVDIALSVCGTGESATAYLAWLSIRTRDIVHGRWGVVQRVARGLLERGTISGDELRTLILPSPPIMATEG